MVGFFFSLAVFMMHPDLHAAPRIVNAGASVAELRSEMDQVKFTVVSLESSPGQKKIVGMTIEDPVSGGLYSGLQAADQKSPFQVNLSFAEIKKTRPVEPHDGGGELRSFLIKVYNDHGDVAQTEVKVRLQDGLEYFLLSPDFYFSLPNELIRRLDWTEYHTQNEVVFPFLSDVRLDVGVDGGPRIIYFGDVFKALGLPHLSSVKKPKGFAIRLGPEADLDRFLSVILKNQFPQFKIRRNDEVWRQSYSDVATRSDFNVRCAKFKGQADIRCWRFIKK